MDAIFTPDGVRALPTFMYAERSTLPDRPGLYFALIDGASIAYVGMAKSVRQRWMQHTLMVPLQQLGSVSIAVAVVDDPAELRDLERQAIRTFLPRLNFNHVPAEYRAEPRISAEDAEELLTEAGLPSGEYLLIADAAKEAGITKMGIHQAMRRGQIHGQKYGVIWLIPRHELDRFKATPRRRGRPPKAPRPAP